jgi:hypothetical protein
MARRQALHADPLRLRDGEQVRRYLRGAVEVEAAQEGDAPGIAIVLDSRLQGTLVGHEADERQRREQDQGEGVERGADTGPVATNPRATSPPETALRNMLARPVDSEIVQAREPWSAKCSVATNETAAGRGSFAAPSFIHGA